MAAWKGIITIRDDLMLRIDHGDHIQPPDDDQGHRGDNRLHHHRLDLIQKQPVGIIASN